jgi:hypothetical protein
MSGQPYENGFDTILERWNARRGPLNGANGGLPQLDVDLAALAATPVTDLPEKGRRYFTKRHFIAQEFIGKSELCLLNACLIAVLRKRDWPRRAPKLFQRLWTEQSDHLLQHLDLRWKVSSITTFADHGLSEVQRRLGNSMTLLFGMMKLYETERCYSGARPHVPFPDRLIGRMGLAMDMDQYSVGGGGLDVNLLAPIWIDARTEPVAGPLARDLLQTMLDDPRTVFARFAAMRARGEAEAGSATDDAADNNG